MASRFFDVDLDYDDNLISQEEELSSIKKLTNDDISSSLDELITVCYSLVDIDSTPYGFGQLFDGRDSRQYFSVMKKFAANSLNRLFERRRDFHLYRSKVSGKLFETLKGLYPDLTAGATPEIYHFALYTAEDGNANRETGVRSPRVYFVLADFGHIYPIFFDPFHELNPSF